MRGALTDIRVDRGNVRWHHNVEVETLTRVLACRRLQVGRPCEALSVGPHGGAGVLAIFSWDVARRSHRVLRMHVGHHGRHVLGLLVLTQRVLLRVERLLGVLISERVVASGVVAVS